MSALHVAQEYKTTSSFVGLGHISDKPIHPEVEPNISMLREQDNLGNVQVKFVQSQINSLGQLVKPVIRTTSISYERELEILGVVFKMSFDSEGVLISHSKYVLSGEGLTVDDAVHDLMKNAEYLLKSYSALKVTELSLDGNDFLNFLRTFLIV